MDADDLYYLWHYAAVDAGGRCCKIIILLRSQTSASCKAHVLGECPFPCTDAALGNRRCCFTQKNRIFPIPLRASGWCSIDRYPDFFPSQNWKKAYFLGFDAPTLNQYLLFGVADILFIISAVMYLSNAALLYWKESKVSRKYHNTSLFLFGQLSSKLATNTKTMTIICVTLTFSICLFVIAPVLTGWSLGYLDSRAVYDIQISSRYNDVYEVENLPDTDYGEITAFIEQNNIAIKDDLTFSEYLPQKATFTSG